MLRDGRIPFGARHTERSASIFGLIVGLSFAVAVSFAGIATVLPDAASLLVVPAMGAAVLAVTYLLDPKASVVVFLLLSLFNDTVAIYFGEAVKRVDEAGVATLLVFTFWSRYAAFVRGLTALRDGSFAIAVFAGVLSSLLNGVPSGIWTAALLLLVKGVALFHIVRCLPYRRTDVLTHAWILLPVGFVLLLLGAIEFLDPGRFQAAIGLPEYIRYRAGLPSVKSLFFHPVLFGWFTAFLALYMLAGFVVFRRWWLLVGALLLSLGTLLSARRKPLVGMIVALIAGAIATIAPRKTLHSLKPWAVILAGVLVISVLFLPVLTGLYSMSIARYVESVQETVQSVGGTRAPPAGGEETEQTAQARTALYFQSVAIAADYFPFGVGLGRYGSWMSRVDYSPVYEEYGLDTVPGLRPQNPRYATDTFWPMVLGELGVIGFFAYATFIGTLGWMLLRLARRSTDMLAKAFLLGTVLVFVEGLTESLAAPSFVAPPVAYFLFGSAGMALSLAASPTTASQHDV